MVLEVAYQFFLLRIYGNHRLTVRLKFPDLAADMLKLRIPIRVRRSFQRLAIGLQAVVHRMQKVRHHAMARVVPRALEFGGQLPHALASPPQGRLRTPASYRLTHALQSQWLRPRRPRPNGASARPERARATRTYAPNLRRLALMPV